MGFIRPGVINPGSGSGGDTVISDQTLGADTQTISFASVSGSYTHLRLIVMLRTDASSNDIGFRFNSDTGANYDWENLLIINSGNIDGAASGSQATQGVGGTSITGGYAAPSTAPANAFATYEYRVPFYVSTKLKTLIWQGHVELAQTSGNIYRIDGGGTWRSTSTVTQIDLIAQSKFVAGSRAILYGTT